MFNVHLSAVEINDVGQLVKHVASTYDSIEDANLLKLSAVNAQELPRDLREGLNTFRIEEPAGACLVSGFPVDDDRIGPTPAHWKGKPVPSPAFEEEIFFLLCASLLGDAIGWSTQQDGYVMHDVFPIEGNENEQLGSGSELPLTWHTEDAFHPYRADYIGLMCLRNHDGVGTTYGSMDSIEMTEEQRSLLLEPQFTIRPDESHLEKNRSGQDRDLGASPELLRRSYARINQMNDSPEAIPVLYGDPQRPYARLDPYFMKPPADEAARAALEALVEQIDRRLLRVVLEPGQILLLDNHRCVHGREPFKAAYDGTDRWLKRLNVARDPRRSRDSRTAPDARVIF